jgi:manganese transport protein
MDDRETRVEAEMSVEAVNASSGHKSLEEVHGSVAIPRHGTALRRMFAFAGPAYLVSVGYMDPGNWATDIEGGATFGYSLLWVLLMSNLMAVLLQTLCARLGLVTGRDLAQACRDSYSPLVRWVLFLLCEIAIAACDLAEVLGTAIGLNLLTAQIGLFGGEGIPLVWAVCITGLDVFLLLAIQRLGMRKMEAFILSLVLIVGACFIIEIFLSNPSPAGIARGLVPSPLSGDALYIAIGILGATVMPHNLYLHSALVQSRKVERTPEGLKQALKYNFIDSAIALNCAFFVNAAILIVSAATFFSRGIPVSEIQEAHRLLDGLLGTKWAPACFAIALICAGQSSTITGTLAGQITMEGFLHFRMRPWLRRLITRSIAIVPAVLVISATGDKGTYKLLILSQVILSLQLPFAVIPLVKFTSSKVKMGRLVNGKTIMTLAWVVTAIIVTLNVKLVVEQIAEWSDMAGSMRGLVLAVCIPAALGLGGLMLYMTFRSEGKVYASGVDVITVAERMVAKAVAVKPVYKRIAVALEAQATDAPMLAEAIALAKLHDAELVLMHVVEGAGGQFYGRQADDLESREDRTYLEAVVDRIRTETAGEQLKITAVLGYGDVPRQIIRMAKEANADLVVVGGHGHRGLSDVIRGTTIDAVRHGLTVPVLAVRG